MSVGGAVVIHHDLPKARQFDRAFKELRVRDQTDLDEHALEVDSMCLSVRAILIRQCVDGFAIAMDLGGLRVHDDRDVGQALELGYEYRIRFELIHELDHGHVPYDTREIDRRLNTRVAAADDGDALALEERAIAMRAVSDTPISILGFAGHVDVTPARAGREDHRARAQRATVIHNDFDKIAGLGSGDEFLDALQIHDLDVVVAHVRLEVGGKFGSVGFEHGDVVLDAERIVRLTAEALRGDARAQSLTRCVHGSGSTGRAATDDEHVIRRLGVDLGALFVGAVAVEFGEDFFEAHAARAEELAVQEHHRHGHDLASRDFILIKSAIDHDRFDVRVDHRHQGQCLHDIRAVVAGQ